ncbi:MAG: ECF-type sigma factor [Paludibaculum sp.]
MEAGTVSNFKLIRGRRPRTRQILILESDQLLTSLAKDEPRMARVVELKFFGGLTFTEIGSVLKIDERTAKRDWTLARAWLRGKMNLNDRSGVGEDQIDI